MDVTLPVRLQPDYSQITVDYCYQWEELEIEKPWNLAERNKYVYYVSKKLRISLTCTTNRKDRIILEEELLLSTQVMTLKRLVRRSPRNGINKHPRKSQPSSTGLHTSTLRTYEQLWNSWTFPKPLSIRTLTLHRMNDNEPLRKAVELNPSVKQSRRHTEEVEEIIQFPEESTINPTSAHFALEE